jgi:hypothetical protein
VTSRRIVRRPAPPSTPKRFSITGRQVASGGVLGGVDESTVPTAERTQIPMTHRQERPRLPAPWGSVARGPGVRFPPDNPCVSVGERLAEGNVPRFPTQGDSGVSRVQNHLSTRRVWRCRGRRKPADVVREAESDDVWRFTTGSRRDTLILPGQLRGYMKGTYSGGRQRSGLRANNGI